MENTRLTKYVFYYDYRCEATTKNWCHKVHSILKEIDQSYVFGNQSVRDIELCRDALIANFERVWARGVSRKPKLRLYKLIKHDISAERYVRLNLSSSQRSFVAQLWFGILPIRAETGQFIIARRACAGRGI